MPTWPTIPEQVSSAELLKFWICRRGGHTPMEGKLSCLWKSTEEVTEYVVTGCGHTLSGFYLGSFFLVINIARSLRFFWVLKTHKWILNPEGALVNSQNDMVSFFSFFHCLPVNCCLFLYNPLKYINELNNKLPKLSTSPSPCPTHPQLSHDWGCLCLEFFLFLDLTSHDK